MNTHLNPTSTKHPLVKYLGIATTIFLGTLMLPLPAFASAKIDTDNEHSCETYRNVSSNFESDSLLLACRVREKFGHIIEPIAHLHEYDQNLITAIVVVESRGNVNATSHRGAKGLMQLLPATAQEMGATDIRDPLDNILAGTRYLRKLENDYGFTVEEALLAYNMGPSRAKRWLSEEGRDASDATYVHRVMDIYHFLEEDDARSLVREQKKTADLLLTKILLKFTRGDTHQIPPQLMSARRLEVEDEAN